MNLPEINWELDAAGTWPLPVKIGAVLLICGLTTGMWIYQDTMDQLNNLALLQKKETDLKNTFEVKQKKAVNLEAYKDQLMEIEATFGTMLRQLPDKSEVASLLVDVSQTGLASGLEFELFKPQTEIKLNFYAELPITIRIAGQYNQFGSFVSRLASLPRIVTIHNVHINPKERGDVEHMTLDAVVKTYRYLDDTEQAAAASAKKKTRSRGKR